MLEHQHNFVLSYILLLSTVFGELLPKQMEEFYGLYEAIEFGGFEFVWSKLLERRYHACQQRFIWLPKTHVPILFDGMGGAFYLICSTGLAKDDDFGFVTYNPAGSEDVLEVEATSLADFLVKLMEKAVFEVSSER